MTFTREELASYDNLILAWTRIQTSTDRRYKYLSKKSFDAFSWNLEKNLKLLSSEITDRVYEPSRTSKYYLPKKSGLVRPITLLNVKDQIFYQALANLICKSKINEFRRFRNKQVFGGFNVNDELSIYFLTYWKSEHKEYQTRIVKYFNSGYIWLAKFDLASFFDIIDHKILIDVFCNNSLSEELKEEFSKALQKWTQPQAINFFHSQGIPQGPCASVILADIYLHSLDEKIIRIASKNEVQYLRYVDDIILITDLCVLYLQQTEINEITSMQIVEHIRSSPNHDWHTAQLIKLYKRIHDSQLDCLKNIIAKLMTNSEKHWILKKSLVEIAKDIDSLNFILLDELIRILPRTDIDKTLPYFMSLLSANLETQPEITLEKITNYIINNKSTNIPEEFYIFLGCYAKEHNITLNNNFQDSIWIKNVFEEHDKSIDGISYGLVILYDLPQYYLNYIDFRLYLNKDEYKQALNNLCKARGFFANHPEGYIQVVDVFNQILLFKIYQKDNINIPPHEFGNMIGKLKKNLSGAYPGFCYCHELRCEIETIHAYSSLTKQLNKGLKDPFQKRDKVRKKLAVAYEEILEYIKQNH